MYLNVVTERKAERSVIWKCAYIKKSVSSKWQNLEEDEKCRKDKDASLSLWVADG